MLIAVYMNDKQTFDGLWSYAQQHFDGNGLMNWHLNPDGSIASGGMGSATDADLDMAWALLMASGQWSLTSYLDEAKKMINLMYTHELLGDGALAPGDSWGATTRTYPDYFSPAYLRVFATVTLNGRPNSGPGLGNIAYDKWTKQIFVSDLETGMIHRFGAADASDRGFYDHGTQGRAKFFDAARNAPGTLPPIPFGMAVASARSTRWQSTSTPVTWSTSVKSDASRT